MIPQEGVGFLSYKDILGCLYSNNEGYQHDCNIAFAGHCSRYTVELAGDEACLCSMVL